MQQQKALAFLKEAKEGTRNDWLATRMLIERELGDKTKVSDWQKKLLGEQNQDGGCRGLGSAAKSSHPLVTGQVLFAARHDR